MNRSVLIIFQILVIVIYIGLGLYFMLIPETSGVLSPVYKLIFGIVLVMYGIYRAIRLVMKVRQENNYRDENEA